MNASTASFINPAVLLNGQPLTMPVLTRFMSDKQLVDAMWEHWNSIDTSYYCDFEGKMEYTCDEIFVGNEHDYNALWREGQRRSKDFYHFNYTPPKLTEHTPRG